MGGGGDGQYWSQVQKQTCHHPGITNGGDNTGIPSWNNYENISPGITNVGETIQDCPRTIIIIQIIPGLQIRKGTAASIGQNYDPTK